MNCILTLLLISLIEASVMKQSKFIDKVRFMF